MSLIILKNGPGRGNTLIRQCLCLSRGHILGERFAEFLANVEANVCSSELRPHYVTSVSENDLANVKSAVYYQN